MGRLPPHIAYTGLRFYSKPIHPQKMVELVGIEPTTYTVQVYRSSQLSYSPIKNKSAESKGIEPLMAYTTNLAN